MEEKSRQQQQLAVAAATAAAAGGYTRPASRRVGLTLEHLVDVLDLLLCVSWFPEHEKTAPVTRQLWHVQQGDSVTDLRTAAVASPPPHQLEGGPDTITCSV